MASRWLVIVVWLIKLQVDRFAVESEQHSERSRYLPKSSPTSSSSIRAALFPDPATAGCSRHSTEPLDEDNNEEADEAEDEDEDEDEDEGLESCATLTLATMAFVAILLQSELGFFLYLAVLFGVDFLKLAPN